MAAILKPAIEERFDTTSAYRKSLAETICLFFEQDPKSVRRDQTRREIFYYACSELLSKRNSERVLLYLPMWVLKDAPKDFMVVYKEAWYRLLHVQDVRENFHFGDCFELDARPSEGLERVVKCAHLTPWLLKYGYVDQQEILKILQYSLDRVLIQSFKDTWEYTQRRGILSKAKMLPLISETKFLPARRSVEPLYVSEKRQKWLDEFNKPAKLFTPEAKLEGPFFKNIPAFEAELEEIASRLKPSEIVMVGGSKLKGYGTKESDLDIWNLEELCASEDFYPGSFHAAHIYLNTIWLGGNKSNLEQTRRQIVDLYFNHPTTFAKRRAIERLESDLLQYRLLHKGFARFTGRFHYLIPKEMEGDCPFYNDEYRAIATMLYAKYVWL